MNDSVVDSFMRLFRGRGEVRGHWTGGHAIYGPVTREHFEKHLTSADPEDWMGSYPLLAHMCSWGCVDIDKTDDPTIALNLQGALRFKEVTSWVERTAHGYHVWVFPQEELVEAETMRRALYAACAAIGYQPKEVNPKQPVAKKVGNWVRLPYNGWFHEGPVPHNQRHFLPAQFIPFERDWGEMDTTLELSAIDLQGRVETEKLEAIAALWTPPQHDPAELGEVPDLSKQITDKMSGRTFVIYRDGPLPGSDRSGTMVRLAAACANDGLTQAETFAVLKGCAWSKYRDRTDEDEMLDKIVREYA